MPGLDAPLRETCSATIRTPPCNDVPFGYAGSLRMPAALRLMPLAIPAGANGSAANVVVVVIGSAHLRHGRFLPSFPVSRRSLPPSDKYSGGGCLIRSRFSDHHTAKRRSHSGAGMQSIFPGRSRHTTQVALPILEVPRRFYPMRSQSSMALAMSSGFRRVELLGRAPTSCSRCGTARPLSLPRRMSAPASGVSRRAGRFMPKFIFRLKRCPQPDRRAS